jgi:hypothetical protein
MEKNLPSAVQRRREGLLELSGVCKELQTPIFSAQCLSRAFRSFTRDAAHVEAFPLGGRVPRPIDRRSSGGAAEAGTGDVVLRYRRLTHTAGLCLNPELRP